MVILHFLYLAIPTAPPYINKKPQQRRNKTKQRNVYPGIDDKRPRTVKHQKAKAQDINPNEDLESVWSGGSQYGRRQCLACKLILVIPTTIGDDFDPRVVRHLSTYM